MESYRLTLTYATEPQLDAMAAGRRWHDWAGTPAGKSCTDPISVHRRR